MTDRQKIKYFQSDEGGGAAIDKVNEFIEIALNTKNISGISALNYNDRIL